MTQLKILAVDISGRFRTYWEINNGKDISEAFNSTVASIARVREGYDRVAICCDTGPSFRRKIWPEYKANRTDPGEAYRFQLQRTIAQLEADGCIIFRAPPVNVCDESTGEAFYAEADDVIGRLCAWATDNGHRVRIYSADKDLLQCLNDSVDRMNFKGEILGPGDLIDKLGIPASLVPDWLALAGDAADNFKAFPGIGDKTAVAILRKYGSALAAFSPENLQHIEEVTNKSIAALMRAEGAATRAKLCLTVATVLRDLDLSFDPLLERPVFRRLDNGPPVNFDTAPKPAQVIEVEEPPVATAPAAQSTKPERDHAGTPRVALVKRQDVAVARFDTYALEPQDPQQAWLLAQTLDTSTIFRGQYPNAEAILAVILRGRALGIPSIAALEAAYNVNGRIGWSARMIRSLAMRSPTCEYFDIVESDMDHAVAICKRIGRPELRVISTTVQAKARGLMDKATKWHKDSLSMNVADVERRGARMVWPEEVVGLVTPDEIEMGMTSEDVGQMRAA